MTAPLDRMPDTWIELLKQREASFPDRTALVFYGESSSFDWRGASSGISELGLDKVGSSGSNPPDVAESMTYRQLDQRAMQIGAWLAEHAEVGDRALLVYMPGLEFVAAFFGCIYAGVLPVPATYPKPRRPLPRLAAMARDCQPRLVLTSSETLGSIRLAEQDEVVGKLHWQPTDTISSGQGESAPVSNWQPIRRQAEDLAFLQYTSGSTSEPRGVKVSHRNLLHNVETVRLGFKVSAAGRTGQDACGVFWLPAYHDMGLIGGILTPIYVGGTSHLLAPSTFLRRPIRWLEAISATGAIISGGPDFAYELCVAKTTPAERESLDLSNWRLAFCGAEPIHAATLKAFAEAFAPAGFQAEAFYPCYGLAEATLIVSGGQGPKGAPLLEVDRQSLTDGRVEPAARPVDRRSCQTLVSCGSSLNGMELRIVEPNTRLPQPSAMVGEIWVRGNSVALGYWQQTSQTEDVFAARLASRTDSGEAVVDDGDGPFLRTGDLGFLQDDQLYVTGRLKDLIILRGRNHYPQDIERTAQQSHEAVDLGAAFMVQQSPESGERQAELEVESSEPTPTGSLGGDWANLFPANGEGREKLVVVHQIRREHRRSDLNGVIRAIRRAIVEEHELDPDAILLIRPVSLPLTSSGKVQRSLCRDLAMAGDLPIQAQWMKPQPAADQLAASKDGSSVPMGLESSGSLSDNDACHSRSAGRPDFSAIARRGDQAELGRTIQNWLLTWLAQQVELEQAERLAATPFAELGVDSMTAIELNQELEEGLQVKIPPVAAWDHPTPESLSHYLAGLYLAK
jgi:acyl-CoA synthetase (AMP-forming)/AMP-acid ligase II/acyl carrier protein